MEHMVYMETAQSRQERRLAGSGRKA